ncbi:MAG: hypothetical protein ACREBJ_13300, partial [Nitrosotalea sp.]
MAAFMLGALLLKKFNNNDLTEISIENDFSDPRLEILDALWQKANYLRGEIQREQTNLNYRMDQQAKILQEMMGWDEKENRLYVTNALLKEVTRGTTWVMKISDLRDLAAYVGMKPDDIWQDGFVKRMKGGKVSKCSNLPLEPEYGKVVTEGLHSNALHYVTQRLQRISNNDTINIDDITKIFHKIGIDVTLNTQIMGIIAQVISLGSIGDRIQTLQTIYDDKTCNVTPLTSYGVNLSSVTLPPDPPLNSNNMLDNDKVVEVSKNNNNNDNNTKNSVKKQTLFDEANKLLESPDARNGLFLGHSFENIKLDLQPIFIVKNQEGEIFEFKPGHWKKSYKSKES